MAPARISEPQSQSQQEKISIAIIGAGPGGLSTAIALSELPYVSATVYEQTPEAREVGAGISIGPNGWNVLGLLGAADGVKGAAVVGGIGQRFVYHI